MITVETLIKKIIEQTMDLTTNDVIQKHNGIDDIYLFRLKNGKLLDISRKVCATDWANHLREWTYRIRTFLSPTVYDPDKKYYEFTLITPTPLYDRQGCLNDNREREGFSEIELRFDECYSRLYALREQKKLEDIYNQLT